MNLLSLLQDAGMIKPGDVPTIEEEVRSGKSLDETLASRGISSADALGIVSQAFGIPVRTLEKNRPVDEKVLAYIPQESAQHYRFAPLAIEDGALAVGVINPDNIEARDALQFISSRVGLPYKLYLISEADFARVLEEYKNLSGEVGKALSELDTAPVQNDDAGVLLNSQEAVNLSGVSGIADEGAVRADAPVSKIVATIIRHAVEAKASDIHIEPSVEGTRVRFRMDGELQTSLTLPVKVQQQVVSRIKIMAQLRLDEKRKPQDGRFSAHLENKQKVDFRVSTFPTQHGEKVVMRILDKNTSVESLDSVGFSREDLVELRELLKVPYGIVLIAGPTGSGKSTTLFAMLSELDRETQNVVSLEDPVEYEIAGVAQSQVRPEIGYTFASGLRSILRQDPDIIMVGEIRDKETAQLAIQAALTGHLVFSTIHTNTAAAAIPRLVNMGVDPYLIAPTLVAVVGQRLVRRMCPGAGEPVPVTESLRKLLETRFADLPESARGRLPKFETFYRARPTKECPTGTRGRVGAFEILKMDNDIEQVILKNPTEDAVYRAARAKGMITLQEDAILKALAGDVPFEEANALGGSLSVDDADVTAE